MVATQDSGAEMGCKFNVTGVKIGVDVKDATLSSLSPLLCALAPMHTEWVSAHTDFLRLLLVVCNVSPPLGVSYYLGVELGFYAKLESGSAMVNNVKFPSAKSMGGNKIEVDIASIDGLVHFSSNGSVSFNSVRFFQLVQHTLAALPWHSAGACNGSVLRHVQHMRGCV